MNKLEDKKNLIIIASFLGTLILLIVGFSLGYLYENYANKSCKNDPLTYGIRALNDHNEDEFTCTCISNSGRITPFSFDENEFTENIFTRN